MCNLDPLQEADKRSLDFRHTLNDLKGTCFIQAIWQKYESHIPHDTLQRYRNAYELIEVMANIARNEEPTKATKFETLLKQARGTFAIIFYNVMDDGGYYFAGNKPPAFYRKCEPEKADYICFAYLHEIKTQIGFDNRKEAEAYLKRCITELGEYN